MATRTTGLIGAIIAGSVIAMLLHVMSPSPSSSPPRTTDAVQKTLESIPLLPRTWQRKNPSFVLHLRSKPLTPSPTQRPQPRVSPSTPPPHPPKPAHTPQPHPPSSPLPTTTTNLQTCQSWANTEGTRRLWTAVANLPAEEETDPHAAGRSGAAVCRSGAYTPHIPKPRDASLSGVATAVAEKGGWYPSPTSLSDMADLRSRGVLEHIILDRELRLLYCAVPKAGSTVLKAWMLQNAGLWGGGGTVHNKTRFAGPRLMAADLLSNEELVEALKGYYFKFVVVRNPFSRTLASYIERFEGCVQKRSDKECALWKRALLGAGDAASGQGLPVGVEVETPSDEKGVITKVDSDGSTTVKLVSGKEVTYMTYELQPAELHDTVTFDDYLSTLLRYPTTGVTWLNAHWAASTQVCGMDKITYDWIGRMEVGADWDFLFNITGKQPTMSGEQRMSLSHSVGTARASATHYTEEAIAKAQKLYNSTDLSLLGYSERSKGGPLRGRDDPPLTAPPTPPPPQDGCSWMEMAGVGLPSQALEGKLQKVTPVAMKESCKALCHSAPRCVAVTWQPSNAACFLANSCEGEKDGEQCIREKPHMMSLDGAVSWMCTSRFQKMRGREREGADKAADSSNDGVAPWPVKGEGTSDGSGEATGRCRWQTERNTAVHHADGVHRVSQTPHADSLAECEARCEGFPGCIATAWRREGKDHQHYHKCFFVTRLGSTPPPVRPDFDSSFCTEV